MVKMLKKIAKGVLLGIGTLCAGMLCIGICASKGSPSVDNTKTVTRQVEKKDDIPYLDDKTDYNDTTRRYKRKKKSLRISVKL